MDERFEALSSDAKAVLGAHFVFGGQTSVTFHTPWNIAPRTMAALNECVSAGLLSKMDGEEGLYAHTYRPLADMRELRSWMGKNMEAANFSIMVSAKERRECPPSGWPKPRGYKRHPK